MITLVDGAARAFPSSCARLGAVFLLLFGLAGCASAPDRADAEAYAEYEEINDPLEPMNRVIFQFNRGLDTLILKPFAIMYSVFLPPPFQTGIHNFLNNLQTPVILANDLLQTNMNNAGVTFTRFLINTTLGVGGLGDPATDLGWQRHEDDFGKTLAVWGVGEGPYLMLPVFGPSNPRDATGRVVDSLVLDPIGLLGAIGNDALFPYSMTRSVLTAVDTRSRFIGELEEVEKTSLDFYAAMRSLYRQNRRNDVDKFIFKRWRPEAERAPGPVGPGLVDFPDMSDMPELDTTLPE
jgi:phospholipid-binding lipoprotein MlaA